MKKLNILMLLAVLIFSSKVALAADTIKQSDTLAAQVSVTRDALQQVLVKMKNAQASQMGSNPDYVAAADAFNKRAEQAMVKFEKLLRESILKQAVYYVDRLNSIYESSNYSPSQKAALYRDQFSTAQTVFKDLSKQYAAAIRELYELDLNISAYNYSLELYNDGYGVQCGASESWVMVRVNSGDPRLHGKISKAFDAKKTTNIYTPCNNVGGTTMYLTGPYTLGPMNVYALDPGILRDAVFDDLVRKECYTSSCVALFSVHRTSYISLIDNEIDQPISFNLKGGRELTLTRIDRSGFNTMPLKERFTLKEGDTQGMPFEISEQEFQRMKQKEKLKPLLLNPPTHGLFSSYDCPRRVAEVKEDLCRTELGCLSNAEVSDFVKIINEADVDSKSRRISCISSR